MVYTSHAGKHRKPVSYFWLSNRNVNVKFLFLVVIHEIWLIHTNIYIRVLGNQAGENGVFIVWGNAQESSTEVSRDILSFTYNHDVFHVHLDIAVLPSNDTNNNHDLLCMSSIEIGNLCFY